MRLAGPSRKRGKKEYVELQDSSCFQSGKGGEKNVQRKNLVAGWRKRSPYAVEKKNTQRT